MNEKSSEGVLTIMFTDMVSSTDLVTGRGDEAARHLFKDHEELVRRHLEKHSGREVETTGDGFLITFTSTRHAITCAVDIQKALGERNRLYPDDEINVRVGLNSGEVIHNDQKVFGAAVSAAARVSEKADGGQVFVTEITKQLAGVLPGLTYLDRGQRSLKGFEGKWRIFEVTWSDSAETSIPIMLVDDHPLWRETLRKVLDHKGVGKVIAEASDGEEAIELSARVAAEVMIMDIDLPTISGIETTRRLVAQRPGLKVLVLSGSNERSDVIDAIEAGASGYLLKTAGSAEIADAVRRIYAGELVFPAAIADIVLEEFRRRGHPRATGRATQVQERPEVENIFVREGEFWTLAFHGEVVRMKDSKGMRDIALLLAHQGHEILASDVYVAREGGPRPEDLGDAGELLDADAKAAYKVRLEELRAELESAEEWGDSERASRAKEEMDHLAHELSAAVGLGGRNRKAASGAERARISVTKAIRTTLDRIEPVHPVLGRHLAGAIKTGTFCSYSPDEAVSWRV